MDLLTNKYRVSGWHGTTHSLTAKQLYKRVLEDSESDYNWIAPARELVRICKKSSFPTEYSLAIKIAILNCFANIEHRANCGGDRYGINPADEEAVQYCYNSLYGVDTEDAIEARRYYLTEMLSTASYVRIFSSLYHPGPTFRKLRDDWIKSKLEEYISQEKIDFEQLLETLRDDFTEVVNKADENGDFKEDEEKDKESWKNIFERMRDLYSSKGRV